MFAIDAASGKQKWLFDPSTPAGSSLPNSACRDAAYHADPATAPGKACATRVFGGPLRCEARRRRRADRQGLRHARLRRPEVGGQVAWRHRVCHLSAGHRTRRGGHQPTGHGRPASRRALRGGAWLRRRHRRTAHCLGPAATGDRHRARRGQDLFARNARHVVDGRGRRGAWPGLPADGQRGRRLPEHSPAAPRSASTTRR